MHILATPPLYQEDLGTPSPPRHIPKLESRPAQDIRNYVLSTLEFLHSAHQLAHRTRYPLTVQRSSCTPNFHGLPKIYTPRQMKPSLTVFVMFFIGFPTTSYPFKPVSQSLNIPNHMSSKADQSMYYYSLNRYPNTL